MQAFNVALLGAALQRGRELMLLMQRQRVAPDFWASGGVPSEKAAKIMGKHRKHMGHIHMQEKIGRYGTTSPIKMGNYGMILGVILA